MTSRLSHRPKSRKPSPAKRAAAAVSTPFRSWQGALAGFGSIALLTVLVALFLPFGKGPHLIRTTVPVPAVQTPEFLHLLSNVLNAPIDSGAPPVVLNNGDAFLKALLSDVDQAKSSIDFMAYIWEDGKFSDTLLAHLQRKAKSGVAVRIALDGYGSLRAPIEKLDRFRQAGGKTTIFHTLMPLPWAMARDHKRNHRRAIIIDGRVAYTGGIAVADAWLGDAKNPSQWRDMMFRVEGSMASHLQAAFAEVWELGTGEVLAGDRFYPAGGKGPGRQVQYIPFVSAPSPDTFGMEDLMLLSMAAARKSILIVSPYFLPDATIETALCAKARSGIAVRVLVPNHFNDSRWVRYASRYYYHRLLRCGIQIAEYQPTFIHTKLLVVDESWSVIGSANMDNRSRKLNDEVVLGISDSDFAKQLTAINAADWSRAQRISLPQWDSRSVWERPLEWISLLSVQQY